MWAVPIAILYAFNNNLFPGSIDISPYSLTLLSGLLAVVSVNVVIAIYVFMAMKEPSGRHNPDPRFLAKVEAKSNQMQENSSATYKKEE
ncbi:hypothetical protein L6452_13984 [Arctium lappa]|uniref:Uncharacterized protein n=1 Tax=Arctium lappa TaxID=4217 RepID=A0ACB9CJQ6_ARCLA|nr:hypothetical protein L6452_13984 [Arctium lappa]